MDSESCQRFIKTTFEWYTGVEHSIELVPSQGTVVVTALHPTDPRWSQKALDVVRDFLPMDIWVEVVTPG